MCFELQWVLRVRFPNFNPWIRGQSDLPKTIRDTLSVTSKKSPNVDKSCPKMISLEKWKSLQKLPKIVGNFDKIIVATGFEKLPKVQ